jgi:hypothetical protein
MCGATWDVRFGPKADISHHTRHVCFALIVIERRTAAVRLYLKFERVADGPVKVA